MGREELTLSATGGHLWERVHQAIADALANLHGGPYRFQLGGGTTLAARWKHRDSFDLDLAVGRDVPLRDLAVNCHSLYDTEVTALTLENADATLERDAGMQLVGAGEIDDPATLGTQAGAALRGAVYRHVAIWTEGEWAIVECRTYSGGVHRTAAIGPGEIDRRLDESGVGHHLRASAFGARRIREALHDACRTGVGHQKVWETGMAPPAVTDRRPGRTHEPDR